MYTPRTKARNGHETFLSCWKGDLSSRPYQARAPSRTPRTSLPRVPSAGPRGAACPPATASPPHPPLFRPRSGTPQAHPRGSSRTTATSALSRKGSRSRAPPLPLPLGANARGTRPLGSGMSRSSSSFPSLPQFARARCRGCARALSLQPIGCEGCSPESGMSRSRCAPPPSLSRGLSAAHHQRQRQCAGASWLCPREAKSAER